MTTKTYDKKPQFDPNKPFDVVDDGAPSFDPNEPFEVIDEEVKKKETPSEPSSTLSASASVGGMFGSKPASPLQSPLQSPLDAEGIFNFNKGKKKDPLLANNRIVDVNSIIEGVTLGNIEPEELSSAYNDVFGKATVEKIINEFAPDLGTEGWGSNTFKKEWKWDELAKRIKTKNRINAKAGKDAYSKVADDELVNASKNLKTVQALTSVSTISGAGAGVAVSEIAIPAIDVNNPLSYSNAIEQLKSSDKVVDKDGNEVVGAREKLLTVLERKAKSATAEQGIDKEISDLSPDAISNAIARSNINREFGENIPIDEFAKNDKTNEEHFKLGLSYIKKVQNGQYKNVLNIINEGKEIPDDDFRNISEAGQKIYNEQIFFNAASNPELIDKETNLDYTTHSDRKAQYAAIIGERLKKTSGITRKQYNEDEIKKAAFDLPNKKVVQELADEEQLPGYDAIPKYGPIEAGVRGFTEPFFGILSTLQSIGESPVETYIRSKKLDTGSAQKVPDDKGNLSPILPSERGNIFYDAINGGAQFVAQVALTRGIGGGIAKAIAADARIALTPALTSGITNTAGTAVSTFMQTWGDSYADYLAKTGDYATARLGATVDAGFTSVWELWLPESKIADRALSPLRKQLSTDIIDLVKKGGDPATLAKKGRGYIEKAITGVSNIVGQEVLEEVGTQATDWLTEYVFSPQTIKDRDLGKEIIETVKATAIQTIIPAIFGGGGSAFNKDFVQNGFHSAAINFNDYKQTLDKQLNDNVINQDEYNSAIKLLSTHRESIAAAPKQDINGKAIEGQKRLDYAIEETKIKGYTENEKTSVGVAKEMWENKIKQSEEVQRQILMLKEGGEVAETVVDDNERFKPKVSEPEAKSGAAVILPSEQRVIPTTTIVPKEPAKETPVKKPSIILPKQEAPRTAAIGEQPEGAAENVVPSAFGNEKADIESRREAELGSIKDVTWEGLMKVGNTINHHGEQKKILEQKSPYFFITDKGIVSEKPEDAADSYILYQNGKKDLSKQKEEINAKYDAELKALEQKAAPQPQSKPADVVQAENVVPSTLQDVSLKEVKIDDESKGFEIFNGEERVGSIYLKDRGDYLEVKGVKIHTPGIGIGTEAYKKVISQSDKPIRSDSNKSTKAATAVWEKLVKQGWATYDEKNKVFISQKQQSKPADVVPSVDKLKLNNGEDVEVRLSDVTKDGNSFEMTIHNDKGEAIGSASFVKNLENGKYTPISVEITNDKYKGTNLLQGIYGFLKSKGAEIEGNKVKYSEATVARKNKQESTQKQPDVVPSALQEVANEVEDTRTTEIKKATKPALSLDMGDITDDVILKHPSRVDINMEKEKIQTEFDRLQEIVNCVYG